MKFFIASFSEKGFYFHFIFFLSWSSPLFFFPEVLLSFSFPVPSLIEIISSLLLLLSNNIP